MNQTLDAVKILVAQRKVRVSDHGLEELRNDNISVRSILGSTASAVLIEDYPEAFKGPTVLALQTLEDKVIHVVWGIAKANPDMATLVTAYIPNPQKWYEGFMVRRPQ